MKALTIGDAARQLGLAADTLRYYDRIGLLCPAVRGAMGQRLYTPDDLSRLRFIRRAQTMNYRLREIGELLRLRDSPHAGRGAVRNATALKLAEIEERLGTLTVLRDELRLLLKICDGSQDSFPFWTRCRQSAANSSHQTPCRRYPHLRHRWGLRAHRRRRGRVLVDGDQHQQALFHPAKNGSIASSVERPQDDSSNT